jgi:hypothetical protein
MYIKKIAILIVILTFGFFSFICKKNDNQFELTNVSNVSKICLSPLDTIILTDTVGNNVLLKLPSCDSKNEPSGQYLSVPCSIVGETSKVFLKFPIKLVVK